MTDQEPYRISFPLKLMMLTTSPSFIGTTILFSGLIGIILHFSPRPYLAFIVAIAYFVTSHWIGPRELKRRFLAWRHFSSQPSGLEVSDLSESLPFIQRSRKREVHFDQLTRLGAFGVLHIAIGLALLLTYSFFPQGEPGSLAIIFGLGVFGFTTVAWNIYIETRLCVQETKDMNDHLAIVKRRERKKQVLTPKQNWWTRP